jgi:DNA-binding XRE family transcriptional regulator
VVKGEPPSICKEVTEEEGRAFAERLKRFRKKYCLTQPELGAAMGVTTHTLWSMEHCQYRPHEKTVLRFLKVEEKYERARQLELDELEGLS